MEFGESFEFGLEIVESLEIDLEGLANPLVFSTDDVNSAREELADFGYESAEDLADLLEIKEEELEDAADDQEWLVQVTVEIAMIKAVIKTK